MYFLCEYCFYPLISLFDCKYKGFYLKYKQEVRKSDGKIEISYYLLHILSFSHLFCCCFSFYTLLYMQIPFHPVGVEGDFVLFFETEYLFDEFLNSAFFFLWSSR